MQKSFEPGGYQFNEQKDLSSDRVAFESLIKEASETDNLEEKKAKRDLARELIAHGLLDRKYILELLQSKNVNEDEINEWQTKPLEVNDILDELVPLLTEKPPGKHFEEIEIPEKDRPLTVEIDKVILPTDVEPRIKPGETGYEQQKKIPRNDLLIHMLGQNGIQPNEYMVITGQKQSGTVRKEDYHLFLLPSLEKMVFVCDEEGNSTFVVHQLAVDSKDLEKVYSLKKSELKTMGELVDQISWTNKEKWEEQIMDSITKEPSGGRTISNWPEFIQSIREQISSEKKEKSEFVDLETLKAQVKEAGVDSFRKYHESRKNHPDWPSIPHRFYGDQWVNWHDLFGREKPKILDLETLKDQVKEAGVDTESNYRKVKKNHPDWPSHPEDFYDDKWVNWHDLFGREKPEFVDLEILKAQLKEAGIKGQLQYNKAQKDHPDWPSNPHHFYGDQWVGWPDLFGKK